MITYKSFTNPGGNPTMKKQGQGNGMKFTCNKRITYEHMMLYIIIESPYGQVLLQRWCFAAPNEQKPHHHFQKIAKNQNENINNKLKWKNTKKTLKSTDPANPQKDHAGRGFGQTHAGSGSDRWPRPWVWPDPRNCGLGSKLKKLWLCI